MSSPDMSGSNAVPHAYFSVFTRHSVAGITHLPLYRLSKLQDVGTGTDACGFPPAMPGKQYPVQHVYTTSDAEKAQFLSITIGNCFNFDGIEGYVAPANWSGTFEMLYRLYNATTDSYILVPERYVSMAQTLGYVQNQTALGYVTPR